MAQHANAEHHELLKDLDPDFAGLLQAKDVAFGTLGAVDDCDPREWAGHLCLFLQTTKI